MTGKLSGGNELPDGFLKKWLELFQEDILQRGQDFCRSASNELL